jgi:hypothetical protein
VKNIKLILILFFSLILHACTSQQLHTLFQGKQQNDCQTVPNSQYDGCMERANESYEEYSSKRKEVIEDKPDN